MSSVAIESGHQAQSRQQTASLMRELMPLIVRANGILLQHSKHGVQPHGMRIFRKGDHCYGRIIDSDYIDVDYFKPGT